MVSGWLGAMSMLGAFMGGGACYFMDANDPNSIASVFVFLIVVHAVCATITIYFVVEGACVALVCRLVFCSLLVYLSAKFYCSLLVF